MSFKSTVNGQKLLTIDSFFSICVWEAIFRQNINIFSRDSIYVLSLRDDFIPSCVQRYHAIVGTRGTRREAKMYKRDLVSVNLLNLVKI
ncbi:hypothetical protein SAMD00079811_27480 [Scytonema sp. HK-05]|nr:hypothetical protein SAMD00079811_27480 [Scytonema sp. HK-05]